VFKVATRLVSIALNSLADIIRDAAAFLSPSNEKNFELERIRQISEEFEQIFNDYVSLKENSNSKLSDSHLEDLVSKALTLSEKISETTEAEMFAKNQQFHALLADLFTLFELWRKEDGYNFNSEQLALLEKFSLQFCERVPQHALRFISSCFPGFWDTHEGLLQLLESEARKEIEFWMYSNLRNQEIPGEDPLIVILEECRILAFLCDSLESSISEANKSTPGFACNEKQSYQQEACLKEGSVSLDRRVDLELEAIEFVCNFLGNLKAKNFPLKFARLRKLQADYPTLYRKALATLARSAHLICVVIDKDLISRELSQEILSTFLVELQSHIAEVLPLAEALLSYRIKKTTVRLASL
jgi:hypothetical protein